MSIKSPFNIKENSLEGDLAAVKFGKIQYYRFNLQNIVSLPSCLVHYNELPMFISS